jgi:diguanylate cyclase (GGDEF)-like protein
MDKLELLSTVELFSQLNNTDLAVLADHAEFYQFGPGETIFASGTLDRELFVIDEGEVRIVKEGPDEREIDLARYVAPESFGEQDFLSDQARSATAVSDGDSRILIFPRRGTSLDELMTDHPTLLARVLHQFLVIVAGRLRSTNKLVSENSGWVQELRQQVFGDKLTGLYSRSYLDDEFPGMLMRAKGTVGFMIVKPDNFKLINDSFGHEVGDQVLRIFANQLKTLVDDGTPVRYRGNEFGVILPNADEAETVRVAEQIRNGMPKADLSPVAGDTKVPLTFSVGVAVYPVHGTTSEEVIAAAHALVFISRDQGGDQVLVAEPRSADETNDE